MGSVPSLQYRNGCVLFPPGENGEPALAPLASSPPGRRSPLDQPGPATLLAYFTSLLPRPRGAWRGRGWRAGAAPPPEGRGGDWRARAAIGCP